MSESPTLVFVGEKEREMIWNYIYRHKKFNHTKRVPFSESHQNRPSVIVGHKHIGEEDLGRATDVDFHEISVPSFEDDLDELLNISKFNLQNPAIEMMYNLYFVDEAPLIDTLRNSFFANWRALPLGEVVMDDYIRFCKDKDANSQIHKYKIVMTTSGFVMTRLLFFQATGWGYFSNKRGESRMQL